MDFHACQWRTVFLYFYNSTTETNWMHQGCRRLFFKKNQQILRADKSENQQKQQKNISKSATAKSANFKDGFLDEKFLFLIIFEINKWRFSWMNNSFLRFSYDKLSEIIRNKLCLIKKSSDSTEPDGALMCMYIYEQVKEDEYNYVFDSFFLFQ